MPASSDPPHRVIRIRGTRGWPADHGSEPLFVPLTTPERNELARLAQVIDFHTSASAIFNQGDEAAFIYLLVDGVVRTFHASPDGERQIVAFHWPGDLFGLAEHGRHVTSAETITSSQIYRFPCQKLERFLLKNPKIEDGFLIKAIHDLRSAQRQLIIMGRLAIFRRLAVFLLDCSAHEHYFDKAKRLLTLPMSRYDIADYLGTSAETVTRALSRLTADGAVRRVSVRTLKLDLEKLKALAQFD